MLEKPLASNPGVVARMSRQRVADTEPKLFVRRLLFASGMRFREHEVPDAVVTVIAQEIEKTNREGANGQD
jgi:G:T-mismatch repair DNA endonuclease (very short patch repair protein)